MTGNLVMCELRSDHVVPTIRGPILSNAAQVTPVFEDGRAFEEAKSVAVNASRSAGKGERPVLALRVALTESPLG